MEVEPEDPKEGQTESDQSKTELPRERPSDDAREQYRMPDQFRLRRERRERRLADIAEAREKVRREHERLTGGVDQPAEPDRTVSSTEPYLKARESKASDPAEPAPEAGD